jgi:hypothetical protein
MTLLYQREIPALWKAEGQWNKRAGEKQDPHPRALLFAIDIEDFVYDLPAAIHLEK